jgi:hypothetical protein
MSNFPDAPTPKGELNQLLIQLYSDMSKAKALAMNLEEE